MYTNYLYICTVKILIHENVFIFALPVLFRVVRM